MDGGRRALVGALRRPRYEVLPLARAAEAVVACVPREVTITVTASPARGMEATLALAERLVGEGYTVVPHLSARLVRDRAHLAELLGRLAAARLDDVFVVAGDRPEPAGPYPDALGLLEAVRAAGHAFREVGITGYPESHPLIDDDVTIQAMWDKRRLATYIVSNMCFDPRVISRWVARVRRRGVTLPLHVGVPGLADAARLARISSRIGIGESARFLRWHANLLLRMVVPGVYRPDRLLAGLEPDLAAPELGVRGLHFFTFNELERTESWRRAMLASLGEP